MAAGYIRVCSCLKYLTDSIFKTILKSERLETGLFKIKYKCSLIVDVLIFVFRIHKEDPISVFVQGCDDDGETHAGSRLLHLLQVGLLQC